MEKLEQLENEIKAIAVNVLDMKIDPSEIDSVQEGFLERYGFNSIDALELLLHVERRFNVEVRDEDLNADLLKSIRSLATYIYEHMNS